MDESGICILRNVFFILLLSDPQLRTMELHLGWDKLKDDFVETLFYVKKSYWSNREDNS